MTDRHCDDIQRRDKDATCVDHLGGRRTIDYNMLIQARGIYSWVSGQHQKY